MEKELICICCPKGCHIKVIDNKFYNYSCSRGLEYAQDEIISPKRVLTSTVKILNSLDIKVVPIKTSKPIPKDKIFDVIKEINKITLNRPIKIHQVVIKNVLNLGADIITTKEID